MHRMEALEGISATSVLCSNLFAGVHILPDVLGRHETVRNAFIEAFWLLLAERHHLDVLWVVRIQQSVVHYVVIIMGHY